MGSLLSAPFRAPLTDQCAVDGRIEAATADLNEARDANRKRGYPDQSHGGRFASNARQGPGRDGVRLGSNKNTGPPVYGQFVTGKNMVHRVPSICPPHTVRGLSDDIR